MEHLLWECEYYSELLLNRLAEILTQLFNSIPAGQVPRVELGQINVGDNVPFLSILLYITNNTLHNILLLLIQEVKQDIIYRRMNLPPFAQQVMACKD
jgi:hypothetical protein